MENVTLITTKKTTKGSKKTKPAPAPAPVETKSAEVVDMKQAKADKEAAAKAKRLEEKAKADQLRQEAKDKRAALNEELKSLRTKAMAQAREQIKALSQRTCACGCGAATKSTFAPGHDAQLHSRILNEKFVEGLKAEGLYEIAMEMKLVETPSAD